MLTQETITRPENDLTLKEMRSVKDKLFHSISRTHQVPHGHIASLDAGRFIASFFIVIGHAGPFYNSADYHGNVFIEPFVYAFFHIRRMGLPFFLLAAGFYIPDRDGCRLHFFN